MSIPNYGKKLIKDGVLVAKPILLHQHDFHKIWSPDFMESIVFVSSSTNNYVSSLHFFWQTVFHQREVMNEMDAEELFTETHLYKVSLDEAIELIEKTNPNWYKNHQNLIPNAKWTHVIWQESHDIYIIFEDEFYYYAWSWDKS